MTALEDLARALRGQPGHDLSAEELAAVTELARTRRRPRVRRRPGADPGHDHRRSDRLSAAAVLGPAAGRPSRKCAIACTFPRTARLTAELLTGELGAHRVTALLEDQGEDERFRLADRIRAEHGTEASWSSTGRRKKGRTCSSSRTCCTSTCPSSPPTSSNDSAASTGGANCRTRCARRPSEEAFPLGHEHIDAWTMTLNDVFGVFTSSTSTLQYVLADLEREFFRTAVSENLAGARKLMLAQTGLLATERAPDSRPGPARQHRGPGRRRRPGASGLDRHRQQATGDRAGRSTATWSTCCSSRLSGVRTDRDVRFGVDVRQQAAAADRGSHPAGYRDRGFSISAYTADRHGRGGRAGLPAMGRTAGQCLRRRSPRPTTGAKPSPSRCSGRPRTRTGNRGSPSASTSRSRPARSMPSAADPAADALPSARCERGPSSSCRPRSSGCGGWRAGASANRTWSSDLEQVTGENLGSRPDRFRELTAPYDWAGVCDDALEKALAAVRERDRVIRRLAEARKRSATARERESVIRHARARDGAGVTPRR